MYDVIHAAIARERVKELVETAGVDRAARQGRGSGTRQAEPQQALQKSPARGRVSLRGLRPRLR